MLAKDERCRQRDSCLPDHCGSCQQDEQNLGAVKDASKNLETSRKGSRERSWNSDFRQITHSPLAGLIERTPVVNRLQSQTELITDSKGL